MLNEGKMTETSEEKVKQTDEELRERAKQYKVPIPEGYEDRLNKLLSELPEESNKTRGKRHGWKAARRNGVFHGLSRPIAAAVAIVAGISMVGAVSASIRYCRERMNNMQEAEVSGYNEMVQTAGTETDRYSRVFTAEELERMERLEYAYMEEGRFPEGSVTILETPEDWSGDTVAYCGQTSTFYLPEGALSDEDLLEFIDFRCKMSYSVKKLNSMGVTIADEEIELSDAQLAYAVDAVEAVLKMDVSDDYYAVELAEHDTEYLIKFMEDNHFVAAVTLDGETGKVTYIDDWSIDSTANAKLEEFQIQRGYALAQECLSNSVWGETVGIAHVTAEYYLYERSNTVWKGNIRYLLKLQDGSSYGFTYNCGEQQLTSLIYSQESIGVAEKYSVGDITNSALKQSGMTKEVRKLQ